jgi:hypothetical protein
MIQQDTIQALNDSTTAIPDSLAKLDSIARFDSLKAIADSLKALARIPKGFLGIPHPSLPQTEWWVFLILLILFFLLVFSISRSGGLIAETAKTFFQVKERSSIFSKATVNDFRLRILLTIFSAGVLSLYAYLVIFNPVNPFSIKTYSYFLMITGLYLGIKSLFIDLLGYVFLTPPSLKMAKDSYFNIISFLGVILYPLLVLQIYVPDKLYNSIGIIGLIACLSGCILVIIKLFQIFYHKIVASFYILLYLCTLEILPLVILYRVYKLIV